MAKKRVPKKESRDMQQAQPVTRIRNQQQFIDFYKQNKDKLNLDVIKKELTRENYKEKFQHLLCWEEKEHERILTERYLIIANYLFIVGIETFYQLVWAVGVGNSITSLLRRAWAVRSDL